jgi:hypothetical protein
VHLLGAQAKRRQGREEAGSLSGLSSGLRMLGRSPLFLKLTACVMLTGIVMEGMYELLAQYFQLKLAYTAQDQVRACAPGMRRGGYYAVLYMTCKLDMYC